MHVFVQKSDVPELYYTSDWPFLSHAQHTYVWLATMLNALKKKTLYRLYNFVQCLWLSLKPGLRLLEFQADLSPIYPSCHSEKEIVSRTSTGCDVQLRLSGNVRSLQIISAHGHYYHIIITSQFAHGHYQICLIFRILNWDDYDYYYASTS